jgi:large subunit ribosomal protein L19
MNTKIIAQVEESRLKTDVPSFRVGDTLRLGLLVPDTKEGTRTQFYEGLLIRISGSGLGKMITVRKIGANSVAVEKIIPIHSPNVASIAVVSQGKARRARLYYLRERSGKAALSVKTLVKKVAGK